MALYLVQHGKSKSKEEDPEQGLTNNGVSETEKMAELAKENEVTVECIKHSGKKRARQTAEIFASALNPSDGIQEIVGMNPLDDVGPFAKDLFKADIMLVGHLPFMEKLTSYLILGETEESVIKFQNSGIVCLVQDKIRGCIITWAVVREFQFFL